MTTPHPNLADLIDENRRLRQGIAEARKQLAGAVGLLRKGLDDEDIFAETPVEVGPR